MLTKKQTELVLHKFLQEDGLNSVLEMMLNAIFQELKQRAAETIDLIVSDGIAGLDQSIAQLFPCSAHQKCIVHLQRNLQAYVPREDKSELAQDIRELLSPENEIYTIDQALENTVQLKEKWQQKYAALAKHITKMNWYPYFTYLEFNPKIRRMIYSTNWIERFNKRGVLQSQLESF